MEAVYGQKKTAGQCETWIDQFVRLEPEGGFGTVVRLAWSRTPAASNGSCAADHSEGHPSMAPIYVRRPGGPNCASVERWTDRFIQLDPQGGVRAVVQQLQNGGARNGSG